MDKPNALQVSENALRQFLAQREIELIRQIAAMRGQIAPKETELAEVRSAMKALGIPQNYSAELAPPEDELNDKLDIALHVAGVPAHLLPMPSPFKDMSIKDLVLTAMGDLKQFQGLTAISAADLRSFIQDAYERDIDRTSLSPQLSRLKADGIVDQDSEGRWMLLLKRSEQGELTAEQRVRWDHHPTNMAEARERAERPQEDCLWFAVAKGFKSVNQRFHAGTELKFKDHAELEIFKENIRPQTLDRLLKGGFLEAKD